MSHTLRRRPALFLCFGTCSFIFILIRFNVIVTPVVTVQVDRKSLNFPTVSELITALDTNSALATTTVTEKDDTIKSGNTLLPEPEVYSVEELSRIVQTQLTNLQNPKNCSVPTIQCGHTDACGLACQIHHRIACLMISYATGMPLIHDVKTAWPYSKLWNQTFHPLGSPCTPGPNTRKLNWKKSANYTIAMNSTGKDFPFPLDDGIVVPRSLANKVESFHSDPFFWWIGQFMKYGLRLLPEERKMVQDAQNSINFSRPIVGIHIRRTDKMKEEKNALHPIEQYFKVANEYYLNLTEQGIPFDVKRVFLASDDQAVLPEAQKMYKSPEWEIIGFNHGKTLKTQTARKGALDQIVKDLFTLLDCDYVVCTHSSNVCRVIAGMLNMNHLDGLNRFKSIDSGYAYFLLGHIIPMKVLKI